MDPDAPPYPPATRHAVASRLLLTALLIAGPASALTPDEAVRAAVSGSPSLRAALRDLDARRARVLEADRARNPVLYGSGTGEHAERLGSNERSGSDRLAADVGLRAATDVGTTFDVSVDTSLAWTRLNPDPSNTSDLVNGPEFGLGAGLTVRQPLLRGGGEGRVLAALREARAAVTAAERDREEAASLLVRDVLTAYWELWYAAASASVEADALAVVERQRAEMGQRAAALGTVPATDVLRLDAEVAARRRRVSDARGLVETRQLTLARLMVVSPDHGLTLTTTGSPDVVVPTAALDELVRRATTASPARAAAAARIASARESRSVADDETRDRVDLVASVGATTLWDEDGRFAGNRPGFTALVGIEWELPIGPSSADASLAAADAAVAAAEAREEIEVVRVEADVARQHATLRTATATLETLAESVRLSSALADTEAQRLRLGTAIVTDLILAQQAAREAELARLRTETDRAIAATTLNHLTGDLLVRYELQEGP
ncbi:MAG: TolC family protein [Myxococcales bacterium]|nr:TolC family protein [Myxococcales bacterium]